MLNRLLRHPVRIVLATIVLLFLLYEASVTFFAYSGDAYVTGDVVVLSAQVAGPIAGLSVADNAVVAAGDPLFAIHPTPYQLAVQQAEATLAQAKADLAVVNDDVAAAEASLRSASAVDQDAQAALRRSRNLSQDGEATDASLDNAVRDAAKSSAGVLIAQANLTASSSRVAAAIAAIATSEAALAKARYDLSKTAIAAPVPGRVAPFRARKGDYLQVGSEVMAVVTDSNRRIIANVAERHLSHIRPGQKVWVTLGSDPWSIHDAHVVSVGAGVARQPGAQNVVPYIAPTTDWVRIPQRFPVEIALDDWPATLPYHLGADARVLIRF
ncbi:HlyD family secretion protein [Kaistia dalseonensis]|uniref:Multidrug efflux system membrane fusion protein n=1 Tax=Kaistia dalseonensis TaxID=410840 RepID=A0ABU0H192_9HYPH|nr:HlyD family secretion protein [Kaistia dalseonensis]MCX5493511.1 HlyD family secretion protein [Kaistia dalseonensis]MDQ0436071.1 multidrug efflux system membrane fusion protein [Kaistia dalseonensis]